MKRKHSKAEAAVTIGVATPEQVPTEREKQELQIGFYGLALPAKQSEIEAHVAAELIAIPSPLQVPTQSQMPAGDKIRFPTKCVDEILKLLLIRGESRDTKQPLTEWLRRARENYITYLPALDLAVEMYSKPVHSEKTSDAEKQKNRGGRPPVARDAANKARDEARNVLLKFNNKGHWTAIRIMTRKDFVEAVFGAGTVPFTEKELNDTKHRNKEFLNRYGVGFQAIKKAVNEGCRTNLTAV